MPAQFTVWLPFVFTVFIVTCGAISDPKVVAELDGCAPLLPPLMDWVPLAKHAPPAPAGPVAPPGRLRP